MNGGRAFSRLVVRSFRGPGAAIPPPGRRSRPPAFTLLELLAVVVILVLLVGLLIGMANYSLRRAGVARAQADVAVLGAACEAFRSDQGSYPTSTTYRLSATYYWEAQNSSLLYQQLNGGGYLAPGLFQLRVSRFVPCGAPSNTVVALLDPWVDPYNYFCTSPPLYGPGVWVATTDFCPMLYALSNSWCIGGQKRVTFDLWSYGPDKETYDAGSGYVGKDVYGSGTPWAGVVSRPPTASDDDIWY